MKKFIVSIIAALVLIGAAFVSTDAYAAKPAKEYATVVFDTNLHCDKCVKKVEENISFEKGVKDLDVSLEKQTIKITYDKAKTNEETLAKAVKKLGYKAEIKLDK